MHEILLVPVLTYGNETMLWKERIVSNARIRELCEVAKGVDERIDEGVLRWFGHVERMQNNRIAKRVYVGESAGSRSVD